MQLAATITIALLHSIWQSGLLLLIFYILNKSVKVNPAGRRNMLLTLLGTQVFLSTGTFFLLWLKPLNSINIISDYSAGTIQWLSPWSFYLLIIYCAVVVLKISFHFYDWKKVNHIRQQGLIKPSVDIRLFTVTKAFELGVKKVEIWLSEHVHSPFTYGFFKPIILLPVSLVNNLSLEETETLIIHELSHIRNNDYLLNLFIILIDSIFFFNPFTQLIIRNIKLEREKSCDIQVLNYDYPADLYAGTLLKAARTAIQGESMVMSAVSGKNELLNRIIFFTKEINQIAMKKRFNPVSYALLLFVAFFSLFFFAEQKKSIPSLAYSPIILPGFQFEINTDGTSQKEISPLKTYAAIRTVPRVKMQEPVPVQSMPAEEEACQSYERYAVHAGKHETIEKEVTIEEEDRETGETVTRVFKSTFVKGRWIAQPVYILKESTVDSCDDVQTDPVKVTRCHTEQ